MPSKEAFKGLLTNLGLTITSFAAETGLSRSAVQRWGSDTGPEVPLWAIQWLTMKRKLRTLKEVEEDRMVQEYQEKMNARYERDMAPIWEAQRQADDDKIERHKASLSPEELKKYIENEKRENEEDTKSIDFLDFSGTPPSKK